MKETPIYHVSYVSTGCDSLKFEHIKDILESSHENNKLDEVTGILVYCNKHFFQILEGDKEAVDAIFDRISRDSRHDNIIKLQSKFIEARQFATWSMAFKSYNKELKPLDNFNTEEFYCYIKQQMETTDVVSLKILADFFDLNG